MVIFTNWKATLDADFSNQEPMAKLVETWRAKCADHSLPAWNSFDLADFRGWFGFLLLTHHRNRREPICKLFGTRLADTFGEDLTGKPAIGLFGAQRETIGRAFIAHLSSVAHEARIGLIHFDIEMPHREAPLNRAVSLPIRGRLVLTAFDVQPVISAIAAARARLRVG